MMDIKSEVSRLAEEERRLRFRAFDEGLAWELGSRLRRAAMARDVAVTIEVRFLRETVFFCAMPHTAPTNADWVRRKRNTVELLHRSSYAVGLSLKMEGTSLEAQMGLPLRDYASHGGSVPVWADAVGCVGAATVSGLPEREDHELVVGVLAEMCATS